MYISNKNSNGVLLSIYSRLLIVFLITSLLFFNTLGFDLYAHSIWYSEKSSIIDNFKSYDIYGFKLPRYLFLSLIYEYTSKFKIPLGLVVWFLMAYANYSLIVKSSILKFKPVNTNESIKRIILLNIIFYLSLYFSASSLCLLWGIAYKIRPSKILLLGAFFHPIGPILFVLINLNWKVTMKIIILFFLLVFILNFLSNHNYFYSNTSDTLIDVINSKEYVNSMIDAKSEYIYIIFLFLIFLFFTRKLFTNSSLGKSFQSIIVFNYITAFLVVVILSSIAGQTVFSSLLSFNSHPVILHTWVPGFYIDDFYYLLQMRNK